MKDHQIYNSQIWLEENISLTEDEIKEMERGHKVMMRMLAVTMVFIGIIAVFSAEKKTLDDLGYEDYFGFFFVGLLFFSFCYFIAWLGVQYFRYNWRKDKLKGKNRLVSVVVDRDKTEHAEYLTFFFGRLIIRKSGLRLTWKIIVVIQSIRK